MSAPIPMGRRQQGELLIGASQLLGGSGFNPDPGGGEVTMLVLSVKWRRRHFNRTLRARNHLASMPNLLAGATIWLRGKWTWNPLRQSLISQTH